MPANYVSKHKLAENEFGEPVPQPQVTSTEKETKPKETLEELVRLAEHSRRVREAKKLKWNDRGSTEAGVKQSLSNSRAKLTPSSFSLAQILSIASIILSLDGLDQKRKEVVALVKRQQLQPEPQPQPTKGNLKCWPEQLQRRAPSIRPMD